MRFFEAKPWAAPLLLALLCFAAYGNTIGNGFHWEDETLIEKNVHIRTLRNLPYFFNPGYVNVYESGLGQRFRPLRTVSFALDYALWGGDTRGYHFSNILLHCAAALFLWLWLGAAGLPPAAALAGAALFALHPVHAESVAYIKNRSDLICAVFFFSALWLWARFLAAGGRLRVSLSLLAALLALLSKEMALALPVLAGLYYGYTLLAGGRRPDRRAAWLLPYLLLLGGYWAFKSGVMGDAKAVYPGTSLDQAWLVVRTLGSYLKLLLLPLKLSLDHGFPITGLPDPASMLLAAAAVCGAAWAAFRRDWVSLFWAAAFFAMLAPVSNLVFIQGRSFAEQRAYIPSAAYCALLGLWLSRLAAAPGRRALAAAVLAAALGLFYLGRTAARNSDWKDEVTLWTRTVATDPSARGYYNLSVSYYRKGRYSEALGAAARSVELDPRVPDGYNTLGAVYMKLGLYDQSIRAFEKCLELSDQKEYYALANLASLFGITGRHAVAVDLYMKVVRMAPWFDGAYYNMALSLEQLGRQEDALASLREAVALNPFNTEASLKLGQLLAARGEKDRAAEVYRALLGRQPGNRLAAAELERLTAP